MRFCCVCAEKLNIQPGAEEVPGKLHHVKGHQQSVEVASSRGQPVGTVIKPCYLYMDKGKKEGRNEIKKGSKEGRRRKEGPTKCTEEQRTKEETNQGSEEGLSRTKKTNEGRKEEGGRWTDQSNQRHARGNQVKRVD
jgi:hypothetical protein